MDRVKKVYYWLAPDAEKEADGRDTWPSRTAFILAAMGGAIGLGNLLRYPAVVYANNGLQWFIPYLIALFFLGIPVLILEISLGQAYRGGVMIAFGNMNHRTKGVGLGVIMTGFVVATYYVPILAFVMHYFRHSFKNPVPWTGRGEEFYMQDVVQNGEPIPGTVDGGTVTSWTVHPNMGVVGETVGWNFFIWFFVWLCMFKGVGITGRAVYFTMGLPIIMLIILMGRSLSLENAGQGVKYYFAEWHGEKLAGGQIWQGACGQVFFSIGVGFGYFTSYASYNSRFANAVQDAFIIALSNSLYEVLAGFVVFGIIGFLQMVPGDQTLSTFKVGFLTYPLALAEMPASQFWSVLFFITLAVLGLGSAFALMESLVTMVCDTDWGKKVPRTVVSTVIISMAFLISIIYCTEFGFYLLDAVDKWTNDLSLLFVVFCECVAVTCIYRWKDVVSQVGLISFGLYNFGYIGGMVLGPAVGHAVSAEAGAGVGFGLFVGGLVLSVLLAKTPDSMPPRFWGNSALLSKFWWLAFYAPNQLRRDLNGTVAHGNNWQIPFFWGPVLRYISAPILGIVCSFSYPNFYKEYRMDPLHVFGFAVAHICMLFVVLGFIVPRAFDIFIPVSRRPAKNSYVGPQQSVITNGLVQEAITEEGVMRRTTGEQDRVGSDGIDRDASSEDKEAKISR